MPVAPPPERVVLVVDDDEVTRQTVRDLLREEGYTVYTAGNGAVAVALLREIPKPCLILLDLMMPVLDGRGVMDALRADDVLTAIPIVVVTAARDIGDVGHLPVLRKPFDLQALVTVVHGLAAPSDEPRRS